MSEEKNLFQKRDAKVKPHLEQYAPVWIVGEKVILEDEAVQFNVIFQHSLYGWVNRRYRYDGFNNVLYHKGQNLIAEEDAVDVQDEVPYIGALITDIPNSYGG